MRKAFFLIAIGAIYRLVPHPWNLVPMGALSLYAGASLPRRWALSFTHISLLTEVLTVINLAAIFNNTVHVFELSNKLNENTITI